MADVNASSIRKLYASISEKTKMAANWRYTYIHDDHKDPLEAIDTHHVVVRRSSSRTGLVYLSSARLLPTTVFFFFSLSLLKDDSVDMLLWGLLLSAFIAKLFLWNPVEKESVLIMPAFGVQLEAQYRCGRTVHRFIPIDKILKPVLNECVTPFTCY